MRKTAKQNDAKDWRGVLLSLLWREKNGNAFNVPFFLLLLAIMVALGAGLWYLLPPGDMAVIEAPVRIVDARYDGPRHALTGAETEVSVRPGVFAVMVENSTDARPQSGVEDAFLVYEAPVEGNITRWMAVFSADQEVDEIGPVRSARPYYVDWAETWGGIYAHVGGSPEALEQIRSNGVNDVDEFYWASTFWRSRARYAPHNVYTESSRLQEAYETFDADVVYADRPFKEADAPEEETVLKVTVPFNGFAYDVEWVYDQETNQFVRYQSGAPHKMASGEVLVADNVAIVFTDIETIDAVGRKFLDTTRGGDAFLLQDGRMYEAQWERNLRGQVQLFDADGDVLAWNPGVTWIQSVWDDTPITIETE